MIPLKDENPAKGFPFVNLLLILANLAVFFYQRFLFPAGPAPLLSQLGFIPYELSHLRDIGPPDLVPFPLTIFTAMFMHGGWLHLLSNMLYLWIFGDNIEARLGHLRYLLFYLICGVTATLVHGFFNLGSRIPTVGASGAISGVLGAYLILYPGARIKTLVILVIFFFVVRIPAVILLGYWILIQVLSGMAEYRSALSGGVAWFAHIGGFVCGILLILTMPKRKMI